MLTRIFSADADGTLTRCELIVAAFIGSKSHGTYVPPEDDNAIDDIDIMGVFMPPLDSLIGLNKIEHWHKMDGELDLVFNSASKFVHMCIKGSPNVMPLLYLEKEQFLMATEFFGDLYHNRALFMSMHVGNRFMGYADSQLQDMRVHETNRKMGDKRKKLVEKYGYDVKAAAHALRLLTMAAEIYSTGLIISNRATAGDAGDYIAIKKGEWSFDRVKEEAAGRYHAAQLARKTSPLPPEPDTVAINEILMLGNADYILRRMQQNYEKAEAAKPKSRLLLPGQY
jgi:predicted nucleotidyltransferase